MESEVWEKYSDENIIIEYFSIKFLRDPDFKKEFETLKLGSTDTDSFLEWANSMEQKNKKEIEEKKQNMQDSVNFIPGVD